MILPDNYHRKTKKENRNSGKQRKSIKSFNALSKIVGYTDLCDSCKVHFKYLAQTDADERLCLRCFLGGK